LLDIWEWEVRVMDIQNGATEDPDPFAWAVVGLRLRRVAVAHEAIG
jgi:hypothetical protein